MNAGNDVQPIKADGWTFVVRGISRDVSFVQSAKASSSIYITESGTTRVEICVPEKASFPIF